MTKITRLNDARDEHSDKVSRLAVELSKLAEQAGTGKLIAVECGYISERCTNILHFNERHRAGYDHAADTGILDELDAISRTLHARDFQPSAAAWLPCMLSCVDGMRRAVLARSLSERAQDQGASSPVAAARRAAA